MVKNKKLQEKWIVLLLVALLFLVGLTLLKNSPKNQTISKQEAVAKVKAFSEVKDYLKRVPNGQVLLNGDEDNSYMVQVYETKNGHTATFSWYKVDKTTGEVEKEF